MKPIIYTPQELFENFYPKEWGDWRKEYNIKAYRENPDETVCAWMCYDGGTFLCGEDADGKMKVLTREWKDHRETFFISCGPLTGEDDCITAWFLQPYGNNADNNAYAKVRVSKVESNLDLYEVYISGCDDSSYTKHFIGAAECDKEVAYIKEHGVIDIRDRDYFFTN